jgi:hypothetical protein
MSNQPNEVNQEQAVESYEERLAAMSYEELLNEFCDSLGCKPEDYFSNPVNYNNKEMWIDRLVDTFAVRIHENPEIILSTEERMDKIIKEINKQTRIINRN